MTLVGAGTAAIRAGSCLTRGEGADPLTPDQEQRALALLSEDESQLS